ncbi:MAG: hypothetical protein ACKPKO_43300 [Candidatus Fonsibacter sp.]
MSFVRGGLEWRYINTSNMLITNHDVDSIARIPMMVAAMVLVVICILVRLCSSISLVLSLGSVILISYFQFSGSWVDT